ncbi:MAG TPA: hypothetical protein VJS38_17375 [Phenylobacterium sp.]|uniref:hypothetical protein n=1 Tax=Phenylobacterium sp. TaxID=1871053 RepID=UPI002B464909|nr:hypothetical protein [Phenylobacterium sp.]HKR89944.1 hypothetical protein [Phenylobacterium sp.]
MTRKLRTAEADTPLMLAVFAGSLVLCAPFRRYIPWIGDEGILLRGATEILSGRALYRDVFEFHPPGGFLVTAAWLKLVGFWVPSIRALVFLITAAIATLTFRCCRAIGVSRWTSAALPLAWVMASEGFLTQVNHHLMTTALSLAAMLAVLAPPTVKSALAAGLAAGAAGMVTPTRGLLTALACMVLPLRRSGWLAFGAGLIVVPLACLAFVISRHAASAAFEDVIFWPARHYAGVQAVPYGTGSDPRSQLFVIALPLALGLAILSFIRTRSLFGEPRWRTGAGFAVAALVGAYPRPDAAHILLTIPLALPLLGLALEHATRQWPRLVQAAALALVAVFALAPAIEDYASMVRRTANLPVTVTPRGRGAFAEGDAGPLIARVAEIPADQPIFFYPYMPLVPVLAGREHAASVDVFVPSYTTPNQYSQACRQALARARWVVFDREWTDPHFLKLVFPKMDNPLPPERVAVERALGAGFETVQQVGRFDLMRRRAGGDANAARFCPAPVGG